MPRIFTAIGKPRGLILAGPTSFAPLIRKAMDIVVKEELRYHVLLIIADGQVTPPQVPETVKVCKHCVVMKSARMTLDSEVSNRQLSMLLLYPFPL